MIRCPKYDIILGPCYLEINRKVLKFLEKIFFVVWLTEKNPFPKAGSVHHFDFQISYAWFYSFPQFIIVKNINFTAKIINAIWYMLQWYFYVLVLLCVCVFFFLFMNNFFTKKLAWYLCIVTFMRGFAILDLVEDYFEIFVAIVLIGKKRENYNNNVSLF